MSASQPLTGLSLSVLPRETAEALQTFATFLGKGGEAAETFRSFAAFVDEGAEREGPEAFADFEVELHKRGLGRAVKHGRDENAGPVRRDGRVFYRSTKATSKTVHTLSGCVLASAVPLAGKPVVLAGRRKPGPASTSRVQRRTAMLLCHCTPADGAEILERGMNPSSSCLKRLLTRAGERWNEKESAARDAIREAETVPEEAAHRLARRGSASPRRGQGSVLARGVLRDRQLP